MKMLIPITLIVVALGFPNAQAEEATYEELGVNESTIRDLADDARRVMRGADTPTARQFGEWIDWMAHLEESGNWLPEDFLRKKLPSLDDKQLSTLGQYAVKTKADIRASIKENRTRIMCPKEESMRPQGNVVFHMLNHMDDSEITVYQQAHQQFLDTYGPSAFVELSEWLPEITQNFVAIHQDHTKRQIDPQIIVDLYCK